MRILGKKMVIGCFLPEPRKKGGLVISMPGESWFLRGGRRQSKFKGGRGQNYQKSHKKMNIILQYNSKGDQNQEVLSLT